MPSELESWDYMVPTSDEPWNPNSTSFETAEDEMNLAKPKKVKSIAVAGNHNLYNYLSEPNFLVLVLINFRSRNQAFRAGSR